MAKDDGWIKLYYNILREREIATLPDDLWRLYRELMLILGQHQRWGRWLTLAETATYLYSERPYNHETLWKQMGSLVKLELMSVVLVGSIWVWDIPDFRQSQAPLFSNITLEERNIWKDAMRRDRYCCVYCGLIAHHVDHIIPVSKGGKTEMTNLVSACRFCNISKSNKNMETWYRSQDWFDERQLRYIYEVMEGVQI